MSELISKGRGSGFVVIILALGLAFTWACAKTPVIPEAPKAATAAEPTPGGYELTSIYFDFDTAGSRQRQSILCKSMPDGSRETGTTS